MRLARICYEIFIRSFCDSNNDGIGDINGIRSKLDYLAELGIEALWITPIHPSPSYHKYDVTDYYGIDPEYGTLADYRALLAEAHERGMAVYLDLVINHSSSRHPWFTEAKTSPQNPYRAYYYWMPPAEIDARGIAHRLDTADTQVLDPWHTNGDDPEKYYGLFWKGMPDLNMDHPALRKEIYAIADFWLNEVGVDGFRLDAARHIYPEWVKEKNPVFWQEFGAAMQRIKPGTYTVGEVWAEAEEVGPYFRGLQANFNFDLASALQKIIKTEKQSGTLIKQLVENYTTFKRFNPDFVDATMLSNHDQTRIGSIAKNHPDKIKLAASMLLTLPGQPYIYYGEEIGMLGAKPDEYIREPFLWTADLYDGQRTRWMRPKYSRRRRIADLSAQQQDPHSIYHHYKKLITLRKTEPALGQVLHPNLTPSSFDSKQLLAFERPHPTRPLLVVHNLTSAGQALTIDTATLASRVPLFSSSEYFKWESEQVCHLPPFGSVVWVCQPSV